MTEGASPLLTDLYQLNMIEAYLAYGETRPAVFELFVRKLPARRGFLMAAGLEQALDFLESLQFSLEEIDWLKGTRRFSIRTLDYLANLRFSGDVHAMAEGTVFFANEPILRVTAAPPRGATRRGAAHQHSPFSNADRVESVADRARRAG
jgi:nicotinate phosphoribosyltransferase